MIQAKCIEKIRDKNNHIIGYRLIDKNNNEVLVKAEKLKEVIRSGKLDVVNLTLTSDNRLIDKKQDTVQKPTNTPSSKPNINIEAIINKAATMGYSITTFDTNCGHKCYIASSQDNSNHFLIIPDDVKYIYPNINFELSDNGCWGWHQVQATDIYKHMSNINGTLKVIGGKGLTTTCGMFYNCGAQSLDLSSFNTSNVADMRVTFKFCRVQSLDLASFNTSNVKCMQGMFNDCEAHSIDLSSFNTSNVTDMESMFRSCKAQSLDLSSFDTSKVTNMRYMFHSCEAQSLDLSSFDTSNVTDMNGMFCECRAHSINLSSFDTSNVEYMGSMFKFCRVQSLDLDLTSFNTSNVIDMSYMFEDCKVHSIDLSSFKTDKATYMGRMFLDCKARINVLNVNDVKLKAELQRNKRYRR